ncbi:transposase domain-containing protein [Kitasatospora cinereorecta]|uniref:Transposase domain-containing protein n=1 Tax=Kitasatospora cinereorecta TaxID=285560 RepID=A0ABW0VPZ7_9ACTN
MARTGPVPAVPGERPADLLGVRALTWALPRAVVDGAVAAAGRTERRTRALPARTVVYFTLAMWLYPTCGYGEVMRLLLAGLARKHRWVEPAPVPSTAAITKARQRLGPRPLRLLFEEVAGPAARAGTTGAFHRRWRLMSLDGVLLAVQDSSDNRAAYGTGEGRYGLPRVRVLALAENATHAVCAAELGVPGRPHGGPDAGASGPVLAALRPGQLVVADRPALSPGLWTAARGRGAELLWRAGAELELPVLEVLDDGSYLSELAALDRTLPVRVVACGPAGASAVPSARLVCSILDPAEAAATDLVRLYGERWRLDALFDELGARKGSGRPVLRSRSPAMVEQEVWAMFLAHHAIRALVVDAAEGGAAPAY